MYFIIFSVILFIISSLSIFQIFNFVSNYIYKDVNVISEKQIIVTKSFVQDINFDANDHDRNYIYNSENPIDKSTAKLLLEAKDQDLLDKQLNFIMHITYIKEIDDLIKKSKDKTNLQPFINTYIFDIFDRNLNTYFDHFCRNTKHIKNSKIESELEKIFNLEKIKTNAYNKVLIQNFFLKMKTISDDFISFIEQDEQNENLYRNCNNKYTPFVNSDDLHQKFCKHNNDQIDIDNKNCIICLMCYFPFKDDHIACYCTGIINNTKDILDKFYISTKFQSQYSIDDFLFYECDNNMNILFRKKNILILKTEKSPKDNLVIKNNVKKENIKNKTMQKFKNVFTTKKKNNEKLDKNSSINASSITDTRSISINSFNSSHEDEDDLEMNQSMIAECIRNAESSINDDNLSIMHN